MPYTMKNPPAWLKNLPDGAIRIGVEVFNSTMSESEDEEKARQAAWGAIKQKYEKSDGGEWRQKNEVSLDDLRVMIWNAVQGVNEEAYLTQVYGSYLVYEQDGKYYKLPYAIMEGAVQLGTEPVEVERAWIEARSSQEIAADELTLDMRLASAQDAEGSVWDVVIAEPGFTRHPVPWYLSDDLLRNSETLFENVDVNLYEMPDATHVPPALFNVKSMLARNKVGWIDGVKHVAGKGLTGVLHFLESAKWIGRNMLDAMNQGAQVYGLSWDCPVKARFEKINGTEALNVTEIVEADSVDIVTRPAAGGKFIRAVASMPAGKNRGGRELMDKTQLWELIKEKRPELLEGKDLESITDEEVVGLARMAMTPERIESGSGGNGEPGTADDEPGVVTKEEFDLFRCAQALDSTLEKSELPEAARGRVRAAFGNRVFEKADLEKMIGQEKDYIQALTAAARGEDTDRVRFSGGLGTIEKIQMACDRLFGITREDMEGFVKARRLDNRPFFEDLALRSANDFGDYDELPALSGIRELYIYLSGDPDISGRFNRQKLPAELRASMDITSGTFTYALGNTLARRLMKAFRRPDYGQDILISTRKPVRDFRQQEAVKVGGFAKLETVNTDTGDYQEIAAITDEESTYTVTERGNILTFSRRFIANDDLMLMQRIVDNLGVAAAWTLADFVWSFFVDNANCSDGTAWFTSGHGNLGSSALTIATAYAAYVALAKMSEKDSSRRLGLLDDQNIKPYLVHPPDLLNQATAVANDEVYYTSNDLTTRTANPLHGRVSPKQCSLLTDTNDWGMILPGTVVDHLEIGFLNGREEPEFAVADSPQSEQMFVGRRVRYRVSHDYSGAVVAYEGAYKAQV